MSDAPKAGEIWVNDKGATRHVRDVDDDRYTVVYSRPAPAHPDWRAVSMRDWLTWVNLTNAQRKRRAAKVQDKDWGYMTNV